MPVSTNTMATQSGGKAKQDAVKHWLTSVPELTCEQDDHECNMTCQSNPSVFPAVNQLMQHETRDNFQLGAEAKMMCGDMLTLAPEVAAPSVGRSRRHSSISALTPKHLKLLQAFANNNSDSFNSDTSTATSVDQLLRERRGDPEQILTNLGFVASGDRAALERVRLPVRFLVAPSGAHGISVSRFLESQPHVRAFWEEAGEVLCGTRDTDADVTFTSVSQMLQHMQRMAQGTINAFPTAAPSGETRGGRRWRSTMKLLKRHGLLTPTLPPTPESPPPDATQRRRRMGMSASMPLGLPKWERVEVMDSAAKRAHTLDNRQVSVVTGHELPERFVVRQSTMPHMDYNSNLIGYKPSDGGSMDRIGSVEQLEPVTVERIDPVTPTHHDDDSQSIASASSIPSRFLLTRTTSTIPVHDLHTCYSDTQLAQRSRVSTLRRPMLRGFTEESDMTDDSGPLRRFSSVSESDAPWRRESEVDEPWRRESDIHAPWRRNSDNIELRQQRDNDICEAWLRDSANAMKIASEVAAVISQQDVGASTWRQDSDSSDPSLEETTISFAKTEPDTTAPCDLMHTADTCEANSELNKTDSPESKIPTTVDETAVIIGEIAKPCIDETSVTAANVATLEEEEAKVPPPQALRWRHSVHFRRTIEPPPPVDDHTTCVPWRQLMKSEVGEQASFELEEIQSTDMMHDDSLLHGSNDNDNVSKGILLRTGSAQSDSSGFAESADSSQTASDVIKTHWSSGDSESTLADLCGSQRRLSDDSQVTSVTVVTSSPRDPPVSHVITELLAESYLDLSAALCANHEPHHDASITMTSPRDRCQSLSDELSAVHETDVVKRDAAIYEKKNRTALVIDSPSDGDVGTREEEEKEEEAGRDGTEDDDMKMVGCQHHKMLCCLLRQTPAIEQDLVESVGPAQYLNWPVVSQLDTQQLLKELRLIRYALHKYEVGLTVLESRTRSSYEQTSYEDPAVGDDMDDLRRLKSAIWRELQELSEQLSKCVKQLMSSGCSADCVDAQHQQCLCTVKQMVELLKEQLHHSYVVSLVMEDDESPLVVTRRTNMLRGACSQHSVCGSAESYRSMLDSGLSELKSSVLAEIQSDIRQQVEPLTQQMKAAETKLMTLKGHVDSLCEQSHRSESEGDGDFRDGKK